MRPGEIIASERIADIRDPEGAPPLVGEVISLITQAGVMRGEVTEVLESGAYLVRLLED